MKNIKLIALALCAPLLLTSCGGDTRAQVMAKAETYSVTNASAKYELNGKLRTVSKFTLVKGEEAAVKAWATTIGAPVVEGDAEVVAVISDLLLASKAYIEGHEAIVKDASKKSDTDYVVPSYTYSDEKVTSQATYSRTDADKKYSFAEDIYEEWNDVGLFTYKNNTAAYVNEDESMQFIYSVELTYTWTAK